MTMKRAVANACVVMLLGGSGMAFADKDKDKDKGHGEGHGHGHGHDKDKKAGAGAPDPQAMMAAYEQASAPAEQHKLVTKWAGKWNINIKSWMDPKQPPMESNGTAEAKSLLGDRYVQTTVASSMMGKPFSGVSTMGYDKGKKKYVGTWIDSRSTGIMRSEGTASADGKTMTVQAIATDPMTGRDSRMRIVSKWETDEKVVEEFFEKKRGKEMKMMEITYTRAK